MNANLTTKSPAEKPRRRKGRIRRIFLWAFCLIILLIGGLFLYALATEKQDPIDTDEPHMKAVVYTDYGSPDVLQIREIKKPAPNDDQVLVKVRAVSINPLDWHFIEGRPYIMRGMMGGMRKPKKIGAFAEYLCPRADRAVAMKPANITFEQAAGIPVAGLTALQGLRDHGKVQPGQKVLINGASGGVGTFAVQIAKNLGAEVTGVCSGRNTEMVQSLGADHVIDYTKEDFTKGNERYDVILDNVGTQPLSGFRRVLKPNGILVMVGGGGPNDGKWIGPMARPIKAMLVSPFTSQKMGMMLAEPNQKDLNLVAEMMESGKVKPVIDRTYPLSQIREAMAYLEQGHARGKVIITVE